MRRIAFSGLAWLSLLASACKQAPAVKELTLASAASLRAAIPALASAFEEQHPGVHVTSTFGASGDLERQVTAGAPVDAVIFAAARPVDELAQAGRVDETTERVLAQNALVLIGPHRDARSAKALTFATIDSLPTGERLAVGNPSSVPAGEYAKTFLTALGKWRSIEDRLVLGSDVSAVLAYARRGEVAAAIVYRTEARGVSDIDVLDEASGPSAPHAQVVAAVVKGSHEAELAGAFLTFVASPEGQAILEDLGFSPP